MDALPGDGPLLGHVPYRERLAAEAARFHCGLCRLIGTEFLEHSPRDDQHLNAAQVVGHVYRNLLSAPEGPAILCQFDDYAHGFPL
ncbi:hypothetical protein [Streptomyces camponoticapitis]|uniref:hypothetical protein n=1 Tax=Streptomyces camponoticapitis TaxID=1616125 RepID=UPI00166BBC53|nr:hypothetical protein [Streptomyces camponoticapitis]